MRWACWSVTMASRRQRLSSSSSQARCFEVMARFDMSALAPDPVDEGGRS